MDWMPFACKKQKFAASHDLIFFVSGKKSSNGKMLFSECKKVNANSHLIDSAEEICTGTREIINIDSFFTVFIGLCIA